MKFSKGRGCGLRIKRLLLSGAVLPLCTLMIMLSSPWTENYRFLRMLGCYAPMPFLVFLVLMAEFLLSVLLFDSESGRQTCLTSRYNVHISALSCAFLLDIWFCMEFCVISPIVSFVCLLAAICFACFCTSILARIWQRLLVSVFVLAIILVLLVMNLKALFI